MLTTESLANRVVGNIEDEKIRIEFIDPASIMIIVSIISAVINGIKLYCEWKNKKELPEQAGKLSTSRPYVRRIVRKQLSREEYKKSGKALVNAILKTGTQVTAEESEELLN